MSLVGGILGAYAASKALSKSTAPAIAAAASAIGSGLQSAASYSGAAASRANAVSKAAQTAQGEFNQNSANLANQIAQDRIAEQYAFNAAQAASANDFTAQMWQQSADWNNMMWQKQADYNAEQAQIQRDWQERMLNTQYQRAVKDMEKAGLNPILAATHGISTGTVGGSAASVGSPTMSGMSGTAATGGLINGISASESNYTGQMEYMGGMLGILSACMSGISTAVNALQTMGVDDTKDAKNIIGYILDPENNATMKIGQDAEKYIKDKYKDITHKKSGSSGKISEYKNILNRR